MAGRRQHYIPRFLQRGFLAECQDGGERTWLHRRGATARLIGIRDIGVGEYFYSRPSKDGTSTLDDRITEIEGPIVADLENLRKARLGIEIDSQIASRLVVHLTLRTAHVRSTFVRGAMMVLDHVAEYVSDNEKMRKELGVDGVGHKKAAVNLVEIALSSMPEAMAPFPTELSKRFMSFHVRERFDDLFEKNKQYVDQALSTLGQTVPKSIDDLHRKALQQPDFSNREIALAALSWKLQAVSGALLPDCIALVRESGQVYSPYLLGNWNIVDCVVLPIAHDRLLIGSKSDIGDIPVSVINEAAANCSDNFFISKYSENEKSLVSLIGQRCTDVVTRHVEEALSDLTETTTNAAESLTLNEKLNSSSLPYEFSFTLTCTGFGGKESAAALAQIIKSIVLEVGRDIPLSELDGVTFAADYKAALEELDRGDTNLGIEKSQPRDYGVTVAKCVKVMRDNNIKEHIIFDASIAYGLLQERSEIREISIHTVVDMLSQVAHGTLFERNFTGMPVASPDDTLRLMHPCIAAVPIMYYAARQSAFTMPTAGEKFAALTLDSYNSAREAIKSARLVYRLDSDLKALLDVALPRISYVLQHAAQWVGHRDGLPSNEAFPGMSLIEELKNYDLNHWLELFSQDLHRLYSNNDQLNAENIFALGRHAERLLWTVQLCPWPTSDGGTYFTIPMGNDSLELSMPKFQ